MSDNYLTGTHEIKVKISDCEAILFVEAWLKKKLDLGKHDYFDVNTSEIVRCDVDCGYTQNVVEQSREKATEVQRSMWLVYINIKYGGVLGNRIDNILSKE